MVPGAKLCNKNVSIEMGGDDDKRWNRKLRDMIVNPAKPSRVVSRRLPLDQAPGGFAKFDAREDGYVKVILKSSRPS
jgi:glutathione-independent formaldehyde dehydrogenase